MVTFSDAKNGERTCVLGGKHLHSVYNPSREAEQFVARLDAGFNPSTVFIIEPALSYCLSFLRKRFPHARLCAIRLVHDFVESDRLWDATFYAGGKNDLAETLYTAFGEESLCSSLFFAWPAAEAVFENQTKAIWQEIKKAMTKSRDVLGTRAYFAKRWLKNSIRFCTFLEQPAIIEKGSCDILLAASGPSLASSLPYIAKMRERFYLIALSSALLPLLTCGITPDLVLSTDGGVWAKKHLALCGKQTSHIPHAIAAEGACPQNVLEKAPIVPLCYEDSMEKELLSACGISAMSAQRNGTVSGTAAELALTLTDKNLFFCGLDLEKSAAFQHTEPNALSLCKETSDNRLQPKETRIAFSACAPAGALDLYRSWFQSESSRLGKRLYRLSDKMHFANNLGAIEDINWVDFEKKCPECRGKKPALHLSAKKSPSYRQILRSRIEQFAKSEHFYQELCPVEMMLKKRTSSEAEKASYEKKIAKKTAAVLAEAERLLHE